MPDARSVLKSWRANLVTKALPRALGEALDVLDRQVTSNAPVASGALKESVERTPVKHRRNRISGAVVVKSEHALAVEYGTSDTLAQPFFRPAIRQAMGRMKAIMRRLARS
jgi:HK97 gp10 family phage protein